MNNPFVEKLPKPDTKDGIYDHSECMLASRNCGTLLEMISLDITPTGSHYLLTHFDTPILDCDEYKLEFTGAFENQFEINLDELRTLERVTMPVTLECAGNGRAGMSPRRYSMPWGYEAVGTSEWTGTYLWPLIKKASPTDSVVEISFTGADYGYDSGFGHYFGRSLSLKQIKDLDIMLVYEMNGQPLLPQHGAPLRLIVPGWYGMASVKWLAKIEALSEAFKGFQQTQTYRYRANLSDKGEPVTEIKVKSLMVPPGVPDWMTRDRCVKNGKVQIEGRAWSGAGREIKRVEFGINGVWADAKIFDRINKYAWTKWCFIWNAAPGKYLLQCRATDETGERQPLEPTWNVGGFGNNTPHSINVYVS